MDDESQQSRLNMTTTNSRMAIDDDILHLELYDEDDTHMSDNQHETYSETRSEENMIPDEGCLEDANMSDPEPASSAPSTETTPEPNGQGQNIVSLWNEVTDMPQPESSSLFSNKCERLFTNLVLIY